MNSSRSKKILYETFSQKPLPKKMLRGKELEDFAESKRFDYRSLKNSAGQTIGF